MNGMSDERISASRVIPAPGPGSLSSDATPTGTSPSTQRHAPVRRGRAGRTGGRRLPRPYGPRALGDPTWAATTSRCASRHTGRTRRSNGGSRPAIRHRPPLRLLRAVEGGARSKNYRDWSMIDEVETDLSGHRRQSPPRRPWASSGGPSCAATRGHSPSGEQTVSVNRWVGPTGKHPPSADTRPARPAPQRIRRAPSGPRVRR